MSEPELHPVTKQPWTCACPSLRAEDCYHARYPNAPERDYGDWDYEVCECPCHDWEAEDDEEDQP